MGRTTTDRFLFFSAFIQYHTPGSLEMSNELAKPPDSFTALSLLTWRGKPWNERRKSKTTGEVF